VSGRGGTSETNCASVACDLPTPLFTSARISPGLAPSNVTAGEAPPSADPLQLRDGRETIYVLTGQREQAIAQYDAIGLALRHPHGTRFNFV
jgi:hypothetical protein